MVCPNCGAKAADDVRFCPECGREMPHTGAEEASPPAQPELPRDGHERDLMRKGSGAGNGAKPTRAEQIAALRRYQREQTLSKTVAEIKPVPKTFLWCLAVVPIAAGLLAGLVGLLLGVSWLFSIVYTASTVAFLYLDQREIKKSGRRGDGGYWYFLLLFLGSVCTPIYLFCSGKDTKRGRAPGFVLLALMALLLAVFLSLGAFVGSPKADAYGSGVLTPFGETSGSVEGTKAYCERIVAVGKPAMQSVVLSIQMLSVVRNDWEATTVFADIGDACEDFAKKAKAVEAGDCDRKTARLARTWIETAENTANAINKFFDERRLSMGPANEKTSNATSQNLKQFIEAGTAFMEWAESVGVTIKESDDDD